MVSDAAASPWGNLPAHCVRPLGPMSIEALMRWAEETHQRFVQIDLTGARDKKSVLRKIGRALEFPVWYGANLDALYDCLTDLPDRGDVSAWLILLTHLPSTEKFDPEQRAGLLDVFKDAAEAFADAGVGLRVLYAE